MQFSQLAATFLFTINYPSIYIYIYISSSLDGQIIGVFRQLCKHTASLNYVCVLMRLSYVDTATTMLCLFSRYNNIWYPLGL